MKRRARSGVERKCGCLPWGLAVSLRCSAALIALTPLAARADEPGLTRTTFGGVGLIEMPSARMAPDGELSAGASYLENNQRYNLGFQALPWLETSFRYSGLSHFDPAYPVYWDRSFALKARLWNEEGAIPAVAIGVNDLVGTGVYGGEYIVASKQFGSIDASLGMGWGRLAGSGTIKNPFGLISSSFYVRSNSFTGTGGSFNLHTFFHGPNAGIFGGVAWHTPIDGLSLLAEYSSDNYSHETGTGNFKPESQANFGVSYQIARSTTLGLDWLYGKSVSASFSFTADPHADGQTQKIGDPPPVAVHIRTASEQAQALNTLVSPASAGALLFRPVSDASFADRLWSKEDGIQDVSVNGHSFVIKASRASSQLCAKLAEAAANQAGINLILLTDDKGAQFRCAVQASMRVPAVQQASSTGTPASTRQLLLIDASAPAAPDPAAAANIITRDAALQQVPLQAISLTKSEATAYFNNGHYFSESDAVDRLLRILMADAPPGVEKFRLISVVSGVPQAEYDILRGTAERSFAQNGDYDMNRDGSLPANVPMSNPALALADKSSYPNFSWTIFPQFRQEFFDPSNPLGVQLLAGATGTLNLRPGLSLQGEVEASLYDNFDTARISNSVLPHVRTDFSRYFTEGKNGIGQLDAEYRFRFSPDVFATFRAGYLESMFAGVGGEILWRPDERRWALGGDLYEVQQRSFDRLFGLRSYRQTTGHISIYYESPWYGLNFEARAGQYLAGDRGMTLQVSRRFDSGVEIGVFATKTNVSAAQFGEGSFDKGVLIYIPLGWIAPIETQTALDTVLRPIQRDGGQTLAADATLFEETRRTSEGEILRLGGN